MLHSGNEFAVSVLRDCEVVLTGLMEMSVARVLRPYRRRLPRGYVERLVYAGRAVFLPPQFAAIQSSGLLKSRSNVLIGLPTSTGKTLLGELFLLTELGGNPGLVCYVAPYIAIGRQVAAQFRERLPSSWRVHPLFGEFQVPPTLEAESRPVVVVATVERFDALLRSSADLRGHLRAVVIDEAHHIAAGVRGLRLEAVCARLRLLQERGATVRIALLSALFDKTNAITDWFDVPAENTVISRWRPTARRLAFWKQSGLLEWKVGDDPVRPAGAVDTDTIGVRTLLWPEVGLYPASDFARKKVLRPKVDENAAYLAESLFYQFRGPVLCVCATKQSTRSLAYAIARRLAPLEVLPEHIAQVVGLIRESYLHLRGLAGLLMHGVAYHNASLPSAIRSMIELAAEKRELRVVTATTTLAEGVDLPFRTTILVDWLLWDKGGERPIAPLLFRNIAGRCGRAGVYVEGDTIVYDNVLGDLQYTGPAVRSSAQLTLLESPGEMSSQLAEVNNAESFESARAVLGSQLLAAIGENPETDDVVAKFRRGLYGFRTERASSDADKVLRVVTEEILSDELGAMAQAASPLRLTAFGVAANATGLSPSTARKIVDWLQAPKEPESGVALCADLLRTFSQIPEQTDPMLRKTVAKNGARCSVRPDDFELILEMWLQSLPIVDMFGALDYVRRSKRKPKYFQWREGVSFETETWESELDSFTDFLEATCRRFLPWILRACGSLVTVVQSPWAEGFPWYEMAHEIENANAPDAQTQVELLQDRENDQEPHS